MYPKSTKNQDKKNYRNKSNKSIPISNATNHGPVINESNLIFTKRGNSIYDFIEISMPYLILYQYINPSINKTAYLEFSEQNHLYQYLSYEEFNKFNEYPQHSHDIYELTFIMSGDLTMQIEDEYVTYHAGDCCICNKNIHHRELKNSNAEFVLILMKEEFIRNVLDTNYFYDAKGKAHALGTFFYNLFADNTKNPFYDAKEYVDFRLNKGISLDNFLDLINRMIDEISGTHSGKSHMMKALLCRFIEQMENTKLFQIETHMAKLSNEEQIILTLTNAYIETNQMLTRSDIEQVTGYNSDYIERIIKKNTGKTLSEFGRSFILKKAAVYLMDSNLGIGDICEKLGYTNRYYFNKIFQKEYGCTPSEYRNK